MRETQASLLIADDERSIRISLSCVFEEIGYRVRTALDGFSALVEIGREEPEILLSDLNMPGMSGFDLLAEVRRRYPAVRTVAMSGSFTGNEVPSGLAADAFYEKGSSVGALVRIVQNLPWHERMPVGHAPGLRPAWVERDGRVHGAGTRGTVSCPECLRTFSQVLHNGASHLREPACVHCRSLVQSARSGADGQALVASFEERHDYAPSTISRTQTVNF